MRVFLILLTLYGALCANLALASDRVDDCDVLLTETKEVSIMNLLGTLAKTRDIHKMVESLETQHHVPNFVTKIPFSNQRLFFLQDPKLVRMVLQAKTSLGFVNRNFDLSHRHSRTINTVDTSEELWQDLHRELVDIFNNTSIAPLMEKHSGILLAREQYNLNEALEEYFLRVWSEYTFGDISVERYQAVRTRWLTVLRNVFHSNKLNRLPVIGEITSRLRYAKNRTELDAIDKEIDGFMRESISKKQGAFAALYERLRSKYGDDEAFLIARDNSLLGILVYDFVYGVVLDYVANNAKVPNTNWMPQRSKSETNAFLYPWRFRVAEEPIGGAQTGDFFVVNLVRGKTPFSSGPRVCAGAKLFGEIIRTITAIYASSGIQFSNQTDEIKYNGSKDIPVMTSQHDVQLKNTSGGCPFHALLGKSK